MSSLNARHYATCYLEVSVFALPTAWLRQGLLLHANIDLAGQSTVHKALCEGLGLWRWLWHKE